VAGGHGAGFGGDRGSAIVDFALVGGLITVLFAAVLQLTFAVHVRNTLVDCAAEGARHAALADRSPADGEARTRELITMSLAPRFAEDVTARETVLDGVRVVEVEVVAPVPVVGLIGPSGRLTVTGHALEEQP
jgi:Flp pilus assembly protein TadG